MVEGLDSALSALQREVRSDLMMPPLCSALATMWEDVASLQEGVVDANTCMDEHADKCNHLLHAFPTADSFG